MRGNQWSLGATSRGARTLLAFEADGAIGSAYYLRIEERELSDWGCFVFFRLYGGVDSTPPSDRIHTHRL